MQESQPLGVHLLAEKIDAGRVAARPCETCDKTTFDRVITDTEYDRDRRRRGFGRVRSPRAAGRDDHGHTTADEVSHQRRQTIILALQPVVLNGYVLTLDVAVFTKPRAERAHTVSGGVGRPGVEERNHRNCRLLRPRGEWPRRSAPKPRDELSALDHSITSSAVARSVSGTSMPSVLAVCRLMTKSNLVDCITGRSAGLAPLRMLPV